MIKSPRDNFVFLETNRFDRENLYSYLFLNPLKIISCYSLDDVEKVFFEMEDFRKRGYYLAGFISYEAGYSFEETLKSLAIGSDFPLVWFGVYKNPFIFREGEAIDLFNAISTYRITDFRPNISRDEYINNVKAIKNFIRKGITYQVNYTFKYRFNFSGSIYGLYRELKSRQAVSYSAFIHTDRYSILSFSPELFFRKKGNSIVVRPMKGTIERGRTPQEDEFKKTILENSIKDRSENIMIVDLLRNDLGRICKSGTVATKGLFEVERYETLFQMVSTVKGILKKDTSFYELFKAIFPSGSVTGAPKISTMEIINSIEKEPRRIYTGGIGFIGPDGESVFNVAIRTVLIDNLSKKGEMGIGSGIVYDSNASKEFEECKLKASFISLPRMDFELIESILWKPKNGFYLLRLHLERLKSSARHFNFRFDRKFIIERLKEIEKKFKRALSYKVRVLLGKTGNIRIDYRPITKEREPVKIRFSTKRTFSDNMFLYHKTTNRHLYDEEYNRWNKKGYFDVIFTNEKNQITEGSISNIIIKKGRFFYTPPIGCGLLEGVFRKNLFKENPLLKEKVLYKKDLLNADEIYVANSVRGMLRAVLE